MTATFPCNLPTARSLSVSICYAGRYSARPVIRTSVRAASPIYVPHEEPCHLVPRLIDGADSLDEFRGPAASQNGCRDHTVADIRIDTSHQKGPDRAEMLALVLDG